jgi:hypothetical protein
MGASPQNEEGTVIVQTDRGPVDVDTSIAGIVDALNKAGVPTIASCSGHGFRPGNIALRDGREIIIARNFEEGRMIDKLFPIGASGERVLSSLSARDPAVQTRWQTECATSADPRDSDPASPKSHQEDEGR